MTEDSAEEHVEELFAARRLEGRGGAWSHVGGALLIYILWQLSTVPLILGVALLGYSDALEMITSRVNWVDLSSDRDLVALVACATILLSVVLLLFVNRFVVRLLHQRSFGSYLTAHAHFQWRSALGSFAIFAGAMIFTSSMLALFGVGADVQIIFDPKRFFPFLALVLILTPFQCLAEEAFVRGYLYQGVSAFTSRTMVRIGLPAALFMMMHSANGDFIEGGIWALLIFFTVGAYFGLLTIRTAGVEAAAGAHTANNIFALAISITGGAGMPFATIFYEPEPDYMVGFALLLITVAVHYVIFTRIFKSRVS